MWLTVKEVADRLGISTKTVRRRLKKGEWEFKEEQIGAGKPTILILISDTNNSSKLDTSKLDTSKLDTSKLDTSKLDTPKLDTPKLDTPKLDTPKLDTSDHVDKHKPQKKADNVKKKKQTVVPPEGGKRMWSSALPVSKRGNEENLQAGNLQSIEGIMAKYEVSRSKAYRIAKKEGWEVIKSAIPGGGTKNLYLVPSSKEIAPCIEAGVVEYDNTIPDLEEQVPVPEDELQRAQLKADLCEEILNEYDRCGSKLKAIKSINSVYNTGLFSPKLYELEGKKGERTMRSWLDVYLDSDKDFKSLVRLNRASESSIASETEQDFLLNLLLNDNKIKIGSAIRKLKQMARAGKIESRTSERSLRRWVESWRDSNIQEWNTLRYGVKHLRDRGIMTLLRSESLNVGDVLVADGHILSFDIIDPLTGKAKRMMLILFFDWASRYPVGASLANTEDSEHISLALRNSIVNMGYKPKSVYLDNGRAFRSRLFHEKWEDHDLSNELAGIYPRLGIDVTFAKPYNARAKVIERFFKTMQEDFERFIDTFRGSGIGDKPAYLMRNEKWIKKLRERQPLTVEQAKYMMAVYFQEMYGMTPHAGLNGQKPYEVFKSFKAPRKRQISLSELNFMMLKNESRNIRNNGIQFGNVLYYHDNLIGMLGSKVNIRYDIMDMRSILIYDQKDRFVCQAYARTTTHPFVKLAEDKATSEKQLKKQLAYQHRLEKDIKAKSNIIRKQVDERVAEFKMPELSTKKSSFNDSGFIEAPKSPEGDFEKKRIETTPSVEYTATPPQRGMKSDEEEALEKLNKLFKNTGL